MDLNPCLSFNKTMAESQNMYHEGLKDKFSYLPLFPLATRNDYLCVNTPSDLYTLDFFVVSSGRNHLNLLE